MKKNERFDGYGVNLYQDDEGDWLAHFVEMPNVSAFSDTPENALKELETAWAGVKESYIKHGEQAPVAPSRKKYSGQFNVRVNRSLHRALAIEAAREGVSLNAMIAKKLERSVMKQQ